MRKFNREAKKRLKTIILLFILFPIVSNSQCLEIVKEQNSQISSLSEKVIVLDTVTRIQQRQIVELKESLNRSQRLHRQKNIWVAVFSVTVFSFWSFFIQKA